MARRRSRQTTAEGRFIASRILDAKRKGATNRVIADSFGINERTVRKIVSGETSGRRLYKAHVEPTRGRAVSNKSIVRLDLVLGKDSHGQDVIRTVNAKVPLVNGNTPTPFDVFRMPDLQAVANAEAAAMNRRYSGAGEIDYYKADFGDDCARRNCGHPDDAHDPDEPRMCQICDCPAFMLPPVRIESIRPIVRRDASKRLVTVRGAFR